MVYTDPIQGVAKNVTINGTPQTIAELLAASPAKALSKKTNLIMLYSQDDPGSSNIVWYSYDGTVNPGQDVGIGVVEGGHIPITKAQFKNTKFASAGSNFVFWMEQFDSEQQTT